MASQTSGSSGQGDQDPWAAFGYLVAGVGFYGVLGWGAGTVLHASWLTPVGLVVGLAFGMYMVFARYRFRDDGEASSPESSSASSTRSTAEHSQTEQANTEHDLTSAPNPDRDDRGDRP